MTAHIVAMILAAFAAIGVACAVRISLPRPPRHDPFARPFRECPPLPAGSLERSDWL